jgi:hypothetical protein
MPDLPGLREQAKCLLEKAEASTAPSWQISADEHSMVISLADALGLQLPVSAFKSPAGVSQFLRLVLLAMRD